MLEGKREAVHKNPAKVTAIDKTLAALKGLLAQMNGFFWAKYIIACQF